MNPTLIERACVLAFDCLGDLSLGALALIVFAGAVLALANDEKRRRG